MIGHVILPIAQINLSYFFSQERKSLGLTSEVYFFACLLKLALKMLITVLFKL